MRQPSPLIFQPTCNCTLLDRHNFYICIECFGALILCRQLIATCGNDYVTKVWHIPAAPIWDSGKANSGKSKVIFKLRVTCVKFERSLLQSVIFANRDASVVATSCENGTMRFFSTVTGAVLLSVHWPGVTVLAISSNYENLAVATNLGRCSVFTLHYDEKAVAAKKPD